MILDHLSEDLRSLYPGRPKMNRPRKYVLLGVRLVEMPDPEGLKRKTRLECPNSRTLPDSYVLADGDQGHKSITLVDREIPAPLDSKKEFLSIPGRVVFRRESQGQIKITHENYNTMMEVDVFLFFSPWLESNFGKDFHIKDRLGPIFKLEDTNEKSKTLVRKDKDLFEAKTIIYNMTELDQELLVETLGLGIVEHMDDAERLAVLINFVDTLNAHGVAENAQRIKALAKSEDLKMRKIIRKAVRDKHIKFHRGWSSWVWVKGETKICQKMPKQGPEDSLINYFVTEEGSEVLEIIKNMTKNGLKSIEKEEKTEPVDQQ